MSEITQVLSAIQSGDPHAAQQLLPLVYDELRKLAAHRMAHEAPGQTLQPTALVHEAYLRLVSPEDAQRFENRAHFFAAAAQAMRRILVENARRKGRIKHGGDRQRVDLNEVDAVSLSSPDEFLRIDEAITRLEKHDSTAAQLVRLRYFAGLSVEAAAELAGISRTSGYEHWSYARAWLLCDLHGQ